MSTLRDFPSSLHWKICSHWGLSYAPFSSSSPPSLKVNSTSVSCLGWGLCVNSLKASSVCQLPNPRPPFPGLEGVSFNLLLSVALEGSEGMLVCLLQPMCTNRYSTESSDYIFQIYHIIRIPRPCRYFRSMNQGVWRGFLCSRAPAAGIMKPGGGRAHFPGSKCMSVTSLPGNSTRKERLDPNIRARIFTLVAALHCTFSSLVSGLYSLKKKKKEKKCLVPAFSK